MVRPKVEDGVVVGNTYDKYGSRNPLARLLVYRFLAMFDGLVAASGAGTALEIGCGEGELSLRLADTGLDVLGTDISAGMVREARSRAQHHGSPARFEQRDLFRVTPEAGDRDLVVCCEVMEHLADPEAALRHLGSFPARHFLFSVPREPVWRALNVLRGQYLGQFGNTPGHLQHWSRRSFLRFLEGELEVVQVRSPLPWTMVLCRPRTRMTAPGSRRGF